MNSPSALSAAYNARSQSKTPWTDEVEQIRQQLQQPRTPAYGDMMAHSRKVEILLWEARSLLNRISEGADLVLVEDEIEAFLEKTETA